MYFLVKNIFYSYKIAKVLFCGDGEASFFQKGMMVIQMDEHHIKRNIAVERYDEIERYCKQAEKSRLRFIFFMISAFPVIFLLSHFSEE